jgi:hypothetical protein
VTSQERIKTESYSSSEFVTSVFKNCKDKERSANQPPDEVHIICALNGGNWNQMR